MSAAAPVPPLVESFRAVQRRLAAGLPAGAACTEGGPPLEVWGGATDAPRLVNSQVIEGHALRAFRVEGDPEPGFAAFLDGTQRSQVLAYHEGLPIVHATVAAVVRERVNRRMRTWRRPLVETVVLAPLAALDAAGQGAVSRLGVEVVDTSTADPAGLHPLAAVEAAGREVQYRRERLEQRLGELWCDDAGRPLFVDGGISGSERVAAHPCVVGVIKSHRTLHAEGGALGTVLRLRRGERSSAFLVTSTRRAAVLSWYLRLRDPAGHDPMWGLVRLEVGYTPEMRARVEVVAERANAVSRWVLAEVSPLALPDARWDKMAYGVYDCEAFLRAIC